MAPRTGSAANVTASDVSSELSQHCFGEPARRGGKAHLRGLIRLRDGSGIETPNASYALQMRFPATAYVASLAMVHPNQSWLSSLAVPMQS